MTPADLAAIIVGCGISLPPTLPVERVWAHAKVESGLRFDAVHPVNNNGTRDYGLMGINKIHFDRFGVNEVTVVEPCTNLRIGIVILLEADARASCIYNTGKPFCTNGYDVRITRAAASIKDARPGNPVQPVAEQAPVPAAKPGCVLPEWDVWARCPRPAPAQTPPVETQAAPPEETVILRRLAMGTTPQ